MWARRVKEKCARGCRHRLCPPQREEEILDSRMGLKVRPSRRYGVPIGRGFVLQAAENFGANHIKVLPEPPDQVVVQVLDRNQAEGLFLKKGR